MPPDRGCRFVTEHGTMDVQQRASLYEWARRYFEAGWAPLTLPAGAKKPPPDGRTGYDGVDMTADEVAATTWIGNIGVRMPTDVLGLDVDVYNGGDRTLTDLVERCGKLPLTWISHSGRNDGSGIRFYRVPAGMVWIASLPGIEIIQHGHRYAVVWPSTHPDGRAYGWWDQAEAGPIEDVPLVEDLPDLPWPWIRELSRASSADAERMVRSTAASRDEVQAFVERHDQADAPAYVATILGHFVERHAAGYSRHDTMQHCLIWTLECCAAGLDSADHALGELADAWVAAVSPDVRRMELHSIRRVTEFDAMVRHAVGKVNAKDPAELLKMHDDIAGIPFVVPPSTNGDRPPQLPGLESSWRPIDLAPVLAEGYVQPRPSVLMRSDLTNDGCLLYTAAINGIHGDSGIGKSWIAVAAIKAEIVNGHHAILVDLEDTPGSIVARLRLLGVRDEAIGERLHYIRPAEPPLLDDIANLCGLITERQVRLVVLDSLGEAFSLDGVNEDKDVEVAPWYRRNLRPLADAGAAVLVIDHATKAADNPLHPSGSKRKRAAITGASYLITAVVPLVKGDGGVLDLVCAKDRHGNYRRGEVVSRLLMTSDVDTRIRFDVPAVRTVEGEPVADTRSLLVRLAELAIEVCKGQQPPPSQAGMLTHMREAMPGHRDADMIAGIGHAADLGAIEITAEGQTKRHRWMRDAPELSVIRESPADAE